MSVEVVGAGVGRTGTDSLRAALELLLERPCHHMSELFAQPEQIPVWHDAVRGDAPDWPAFLADYGAVVDYPSAAFWPELTDAFPDALVLLSVRDADSWWESADRTIFAAARRGAPPDTLPGRQLAMAVELLSTRLTPDWHDREAAIAAFERHNQAVRDAVPADRLVEWRPGDGWEPLCDALGVPVPDEPFPHRNTTADFRAMAGLDD